MSSVAPPAPPAPPAERGDPSNRWPWIALVLGLLIVAFAVVYFVLNRPSGVNITVEGTVTPNPVARAASPGPPATLAPPAAATSAPLGATATPVPVPTKPAAPTAPPTPVPAPTPPPAPAVAPAGASPQAGAPAAPGGQPAAPPAQPAAPAAQATPPPAAPPTSAAPPSPTPFAGQVANAGGFGNQRSDIDAAYGGPIGETPEHLVVYRKGTFEYHVGYVPDLNGRAGLIVEQPQQGSQPLTLQQAQSEAHKLLPKDAQPPNPTPEGNDQFVVERFTSQTLAQALPPEAFAPGGGQPGQLMIVYVKNPQGNVTRLIVGPGNDANALMNQGR